MHDASVKHRLDTTNHIQNFVIHYFRAEVGRETAWRQRLDVTFDWAVVATGGMVTLGLSTPDAGHVILLATTFIILFFLHIEARRYRIYAKLKYRVRRIEEDYIAPLFNQIAQVEKGLDDRPHIDPGMLESLLKHESPITHLEAVATRLRSNYIYLLSVIYLVWLINILDGRVGQPWWDFINQQARVGGISGIIVCALFTALMLLSVALCLSVTQKP
ncbi:MAG: DUF2270 domain-containing protein [Chloroflexota bacterium]